MLANVTCISIGTMRYRWQCLHVCIENENFFRFVEICISVFHLRLRIKIVFYTYSTKGCHFENNKCKNVQLKIRHDNRIHS